MQPIPHQTIQPFIAFAHVGGSRRQIDTRRRSHAKHTLSLWERLTRFLEYPVLELSTNLAENSMRPIVLGRKNWLHLGSEQAGPKIAAILSIVESCRRMHIPVRNYLADVLPGLNDLSIHRVAELTPRAWSGKHP